jgi:tRNA-splicing ligase RtcB
VQKIGNVLAWGSDIEAATIEQAAKASRLPFIDGHLALMPDAHIGIGATIGSVIPTRGAIVPAAVGVDIGCGMIAVETDLVADGLPDNLDPLHGWIAEVVPAGVGKGHASARGVEIPAHFSQKEAATAANQYGSLGSGNHFVEVCLDERDRVWVVLHSGSRGIGNQLAKKHIDGAKRLMRQWFIELDDPDLAYLVQGTHEFDAYISDMQWAQRYALGNRAAMMDAVLTQLWGFVGVDREHGVGNEVRRINCHHNFTQMENHHGRNVWLTRKGAIKAGTGDEGVIPGSMGTSSYIVRGLGNPASYESCSHGAGRRMSRSAARKTLTVESLETAMKGRAWNDGDAKALLDEHPDSYKSIDQVMADQADLVAIEHTLHQVLNYKGT